MKRRLSTVLLALGLTVSAFSLGVYAEESETQVTEPVTETEAVTENAAEQDLEELESEVAEVETESQTEAEALSEEEQLQQLMGQYLAQISAYTEEQIDAMLESDDASAAMIAANWSSVKEELGAFVEVTGAELSEDGTAIVSHAKYEKVNDKTDVVVTYKVDQKAQTVSFEWDIQYPMSLLMQRAALNTVMGIGIVFLVLLFLSWLIGKLHIIPDMVEKRAKKDAPAPAAAPAAPAAAAPAVVEEEEDLTDDLELVAVITAAIAASENTSSDGFVVRSIKKANKRNWQRA